MKSAFFTIVYILITGMGYGQETFSLDDTCRIKCKYSFTYHSDTANPLIVGSDLMVLEVGDKSSLYYSYYRRLGDSLFADDEAKGKIATGPEGEARYYMPAAASAIAKNYPVGQVTVTDRLAFSYYLYKEPLSTQNWIISVDTAVIFKLKCQKATTHFRGRNYEVWFSRDIPVSSGPWKFYGLPGLVVKAGDSAKQFLFELSSVEIMQEKKAMEIYHPATMFNDNKFVETSRLEFLDLKRFSKEDPIGFAEVNSGVFEMKVDMTTEERKAKKQPYNPIELE